MNVLLVGAGSIGSRHLVNLKELGHTVHAVDTNPDQLQKADKIAEKTFTSLDDALGSNSNYDAAFICTFSNAHVQPAMKCARAGCHLFIEKPLSLDMEGVDELVKAVADRKLITMVGCNMRFHPAISAVHKILTENPAFKKKLWANIEYGYHLPTAKKNYESSYMANRSMGGNMIFDVIHELDYAAWFFGPPAKVICTRGIVSELKIDTEDYVDMMIEFRDGTACTVHMDYLQHGYSRRCKVVCDGGTVVWDFAQGNLAMITKDNPQWDRRDMKLDIHCNRMYIDEIKYFMDCIGGGVETFNSVHSSIATLKLAIAADISCKTKVWESV